jgi:hypothetical protein
MDLIGAALIAGAFVVLAIAINNKKGFTITHVHVDEAQKMELEFQKKRYEDSMNDVTKSREEELIEARKNIGVEAGLEGLYDQIYGNENVYKDIHGLE